jgi:hypothetical protein
MLLSLPKLIEPLFLRAGWQPGRDRHVQTPANAGPEMLATCIIEEFGGLSVGESGPGTEQAASDVHFYSHLRRSEVSEVVAPWSDRVGEVAAFATAHCDHMILLIGSGSRFYVFTDVDERLYDAGTDFGNLMYRLLFGYRIGSEVCRDDWVRE